MSTQPYRESAAMPDEPVKEWWEKEEPTEKERELWARFYEANILSPREFKNGDPSKRVDYLMGEYRKRFGRI